MLILRHFTRELGPLPPFRTWQWISPLSRMRARRTIYLGFPALLLLLPRPTDGYQGATIMTMIPWLQRRRPPDRAPGGGH